MPITRWASVCVCVMGGVRGSFAHSCRGSEWKLPLYRMKASEDYPLTMKCDDPPSPSDTGRVQLNIALGTKPWSLLCEKTSECVLVIRRVSLPFLSYKTPASFFILLHCRLNIPKLQSVCQKLHKAMDDSRKLWGFISIYFTLAHNWLNNWVSRWMGSAFEYECLCKGVVLCRAVHLAFIFVRSVCAHALACLRVSRHKRLVWLMGCWQGCGTLLGPTLPKQSGGGDKLWHVYTQTAHIQEHT